MKRLDSKKPAVAVHEFVEAFVVVVLVVLVVDQAFIVGNFRSLLPPHLTPKSPGLASITFFFWAFGASIAYLSFPCCSELTHFSAIATRNERSSTAKYSRTQPCPLYSRIIFA